MEKDSRRQRNYKNNQDLQQSLALNDMQEFAKLSFQDLAENSDQKTKDITECPLIFKDIKRADSEIIVNFYFKLIARRR